MNLSFNEARKAYDNDQLDRAIEKYQGILNQKYYAPEVFFNLANAHFRNGEPGRAILNYRRAARLAPRDPDIQANLTFAVQQTGADIPVEHPLIAVSRSLDIAQWMGVTAGAWWLALILFSIFFISRFIAVLPGNKQVENVSDR